MWHFISVADHFRVRESLGSELEVGANVPMAPQRAALLGTPSIKLPHVFLSPSGGRGSSERTLTLFRPMEPPRSCFRRPSWYSDDRRRHMQKDLGRASDPVVFGAWQAPLSRAVLADACRLVE